MYCLSEINNLHEVSKQTNKQTNKQSGLYRVHIKCKYVFSCILFISERQYISAFYMYSI
jgi:hypothetical protein